MRTILTPWNNYGQGARALWVRWMAGKMLVGFTVEGTWELVLLRFNICNKNLSGELKAAISIWNWPPLLQAMMRRK